LDSGQRTKRRTKRKRRNGSKQHRGGPAKPNTIKKGSQVQGQRGGNPKQTQRKQVKMTNSCGSKREGALENKRGKFRKGRGTSRSPHTEWGPSGAGK